MIQPIIIQGDGFLVLVMPLNTGGVRRSDLVQEEAGKTVPFPVQEKRTVEGSKDLAKAA
jgi:hypothetical protein